MRALLCTDGSPSAFEAERVLTAIADRARVEVAVLSVIPTGLPPLPPWREEFEAEWTPKVEAAAIRLAAAGFTVRGAMTYGLPGGSIIREAERGTYDLTVIGSGGRSWQGNLLLGSVGRRVLYCSNSSVLITHRAPESRDSNLVVVGIDGSRPSMHVVEQLVTLLDASTCRVLVAAITAGSLLRDLPLRSGGREAWIRHEQRNRPLPARATRAAEQSAAKFDRAGIDVSVTVEEGRPVEGLLDIIDKDGADLVAVGASGLGVMRRGLLGSVSDQVSRLAPATLVVRTPSWGVGQRPATSEGKAGVPAKGGPYDR